MIADRVAAEMDRALTMILPVLTFIWTYTRATALRKTFNKIITNRVSSLWSKENKTPLPPPNQDLQASSPFLFLGHDAACHHSHETKRERDFFISYHIPQNLTYLDTKTQTKNIAQTISRTLIPSIRKEQKTKPSFFTEGWGFIQVLTSPHENRYIAYVK